jgi:dipeptidyl aminopeptidase/acylaminoacyl peptidase
MTGMTARDLSILAHAGEVRVAPDGRRIAYTVITVDTEANRYRTRIWLADVNASAPPRPLTAGAWADTLPRWSPDGRSLAFARSAGPGEEAGLWIAPVDGPGEISQLCSRPDEITDIAWSPDGTQLAVVARVPDPARYGTPGKRPPVGALPPRRINHLFSTLNAHGWIYDRPTHVLVVPVDGSASPQDLTEGPWAASSPTWSPDGTRLAFVSARHEDWDLDLCNDVWVVSALGGIPEALTDTSASWALLSWSPDGNRLAFTYDPTPRDEPRHGRVGVLDIETGNRRELSTMLDRLALSEPGRARLDWQRRLVPRRGGWSHPRLPRGRGRGDSHADARWQTGGASVRCD